jgi:hypothetical protein
LARKPPSARERAIREVEPLIGVPDGVAALERHLLERSSLPGPRANLELAAAFADAVAARGLGSTEWSIVRRWLDVPTSAPDPRAEYLPVCALQALGAAYTGLDSNDRRAVLDALRRAAVDSRWRVRESVAIGLQRLGEVDPASFAAIVRDWAGDPSPLVRRATLAALAHPPILREAQSARMALSLGAEIFDSFVQAPPLDRRADDYQVLRRALEYAPSVIVAAQPDEGFQWLSRLAESPDADVRRIVRANLGKKRLSQRHQDRVGEVLACLGR